LKFSSAESRPIAAMRHDVIDDVRRRNAATLQTEFAESGAPAIEISAASATSLCRKSAATFLASSINQ
jgi:hypothetical protein